MVDLSTKDFKDILDVNSELLDCRTLVQLRMTAMASMRRILDADTSVFFSVVGSKQNRSIDHGVAFGADNTDLVNYHDRYMKLDPFLSWAMNDEYSLRAPVIVSDHLVHYRSFERTEFYNDFFRPISVHSVLGITLHSDAKSIGLLAVHRPKNALPFNRRDQAKAQLTVPGLLAALERVKSLEQVNEHESILNDLALELPCEGVIVLDSELNPVFCDARARELLKVEPGKQLNTVKIPDALSRVCKKLMEEVGQSNNLPPPRVEFGWHGANKLGVRVRLVHAGIRGVRLIMYFENEQKSLVCDHRLKELGLTRREIDIVQLVCRGQTNSQIAENLCISERTVENHLRSIYTKSGVHSRTSLIYLLIAGN